MKSSGGIGVPLDDAGLAVALDPTGRASSLTESVRSLLIEIMSFSFGRPLAQNQ
jgi:hypothetical protein